MKFNLSHIIQEAILEVLKEKNISLKPRVLNLKAKGIPDMTAKEDAYFEFIKLYGRKAMDDACAAHAKRLSIVTGKDKIKRDEKRAKERTRTAPLQETGNEEEIISEKKKKSHYVGFDKLEKSLAHKKGVKDPGAIAAAIGRKKYGKGKFQKAAASGHKLKESGGYGDMEETGMPSDQEIEEELTFVEGFDDFEHDYDDNPSLIGQGDWDATRREDHDNDLMEIIRQWFDENHLNPMDLVHSGRHAGEVDRLLDHWMEKMVEDRKLEGMMAEWGFDLEELKNLTKKEFGMVEESSLMEIHQKPNFFTRLK